MNINLKIWRQSSDSKSGGVKKYRLENIDPNISFLEMLDILNIKLVKEKKDPVAFDHDCREGICGSCGFMINGQPVSYTHLTLPTIRTVFVSSICELLKTKMIYC